MKKIYSFFLLLGLLLSVGNVWGADETIVFADLGLENGVQYTDPFDGGGFTVTFAGGGNDGKYYTTGSGIRVYGNGTMTIASETETKISTIEITYDGTNKPTTDDIVNNGSYDNATGTWEGDATSVTFTRPSGSGHWRVQSIAVTYSTGGTPSPTISANNVNIAFDATAGSITYTVNNPVEGGAISAAITAGNEGSWLTLGQGTTSPIAFTCVANEGVDRTATVTLTYTYNTNETITKDIIITQAANPNIVDNISDITAAGTYTVRGTIVAKSQRGFIVGDGTGYVYYYNQSYTQANYNIGDMVKLSGSVVAYGGVFEFNNTTTVTEATESSYVPDIPIALSGSDMDTRVASTSPTQLSNYVQYEGILSVSGTYYNITSIEGASTAKGSISFPVNTDFTSLDGQLVRVKGYYVGISSNQYYNTMIGSIEEVVVVTPTITANTNSLTGFTYEEGNGPSEAQSISVSGANLTADISLSLGESSNFEMSLTENSGYTNTLALNPTEGSVATTTIYVRLKGDLDVNNSYNGTITITSTGAESKSVSLAGSVTAPVVPTYASLPFAFDDGRADIENVDGLYQEGLGTDYNSSPKLKFDGAGDYVILQFSERPGVLTFDIKGNPGGNPSGWEALFKIQTSENGTDWSDLDSYDDLSSTVQHKSFENLDAAVRYIKWIYVSKTKGNVALGNIALAKYVEPSLDPSITVTSTAIEAPAAGADGTINVTYNNITTIVAAVYFCDVNGGAATYDWVDAEINNENNVEYLIDANTGAARTAYMKVYALDDQAQDVYSELITISQEAYVPPTPAAHYVVVSDVEDIVPGAHYLIASGTEDGIRVMGVQNNNNRFAAEWSAENGEIDIPEGSGDEIHEFIICKDGGDKYAIYEAGVGYLYAASSSSNNLKSQATNNANGQWTITINDNIASIVATGSNTRNVMQYNSTSVLFSCYGSASQAPVYLYRKTGETFTTETVTISEVGYATLYYGEENLIVPEDVTAYIFNTTDGLKKAYDAGEVIPKTVGVVLEGPVGNYDFVVTPVVGMGPAANNLKGSDVAATTTGGDVYYALSLNAQGEDVGFYYMEEGGAAFQNGAHKAYLALSNSQAPARFYIFNGATNINNIEDVDDAVKFMENGKLFIKKNGVIYNAVGAKVK